MPSFTDPQIQALAAQFPANEHEQRAKGGRTLTYLPWECVAERLAEVFGVRWSWEIVSQQVDLAAKVVVIHGRLAYTDSLGTPFHHDGIGAHDWGVTKMDVDDAVKSAMAEALKKAAHTLTVGLYLWDENDLKAIELAIRTGGTTTAPMTQPAAASPPQPGYASDYGTDSWKGALGRFWAKLREIGTSNGHPDDIITLAAQQYVVQAVKDANYERDSAGKPIPSTKALSEKQLTSALAGLEREDWQKWLLNVMASARGSAA